MRVEDLTKFEGECPTIVVFSTYMDIRIPLTKKWKKIINEKEDKPNTYHNNLIDYISEQIELSGFNMKSIGNLLIKKIVFNENFYVCQPLSFYKSQREIQKVNPLYAFKVATAYFREQGMIPVFKDANCRLMKI